MMRGDNRESQSIICVKTTACRRRRDAGEIYILTSHSGLSHRENSNNLEHGGEPNRFSYKLRQQKADDEYLMRLWLARVSFAFGIFFFPHLFPPYICSLCLSPQRALMRSRCVLAALRGRAPLCCSASGEDKLFGGSSVCMQDRMQTGFRDSAAVLRP